MYNNKLQKREDRQILQIIRHRWQWHINANIIRTKTKKRRHHK